MKPNVAIATKLLVGITLATGSLTACGKKADSDPAALEGRSAGSEKVDDQFGQQFGEAHRVDPNAEPVDVSEGDVAPISLDTEPVPIG